MSGSKPGAVFTALLRVTPKRRSKIVVHSAPDFEDGALAVVEELLARGHKPLILLEKPLTDGANGANLAERGVTFAEKNSMRGRLNYLNAGTVFTTHGPYRPHAPASTQKVVYLGHGEPIAKSAGYWLGDEAVGATVALASSSVGKALRCAQHGLRPEQVLLVGAPRNDRLLRIERESTRRAVADLLPDDTSTLFLWLPTFRRHAHGGVDGVERSTALPLELEDLERLDEWLAAHDAAILAKPHPASRSYPAGALERIRTIEEAALRSADLSLPMLLVAADCLITDASSVWFDFLLLDKPLICCFPDLAEYRSARGINLEPYDAWFPGPIVADAHQLLEEMSNVAGGADPHAEKREWLTRALHLHRDGRAAPRLLDALGL